MARLPITIDSSTQQNILPTAELQVQGNTPDAFGGGIGKGLTQLGDSGVDAASAFGKAQLIKAEDDRRLANFDRQATFVAFGSDQATKLEEKARDLSGPAQGFTADAMSGFDTDAQQFLDGIPERDRHEWSAKMAGLRSSVAGQALRTEFQQRDSYYKTTLGDTLGHLANGAASTPGGLDSFRAQGDQVIAASGLSAQDKADQISQWHSNVALAAAQGDIQTDPTGALARLGGIDHETKIDAKAATTGGGDLLSRMLSITMQSESAGDPNAVSPKGARGLMQVMPSTQGDPGFGVAPLPANATPEQVAVQGRQYLGALLTHYGSAEKAWAAYNAGPGRLDSAIVKGGDAWLSYMPAETRSYVWKNVAALGGTGTQTAQAGLPPGQASDAPALDMPSGNGTVDPRYGDLNVEQRMQLIGAAQREVDRRQAVAATATAAQHAQWLNQLELDINDGKAGQQDIDAARKMGVLTDYNEVDRLQKQVQERDKQNADLNFYNGAIGTPGFTWNPYDDQQKKAVEAAVKAQGGTPLAAFNVWQKTGILAEQASAAMRGGLVSTDPQAVQSAANLAGNMVRRSPNAFAAVPGGDDMEKAALAFNHYTYDLGYSPQQAAQRVASENTPEFKAKVKIGQPVLDDYRKQLRQQGADSAGSVFAQWGPDPTFYTAGQKAEADQTYTDLVVDNLAGGRDMSTAKAMAAAQLRKVYGTTAGGTRIMKYPPERGYPAIGGGYQYLYDDAVSTVKQETGRNVGYADVMLLPIPGVTDQDFRTGRPPRYSLVYTHDVDGQRVLDRIPGQWAADTSAAAVSAAAHHAGQFATARASSLAAQAAAAARQMDPTMKTSGLPGAR